MKRRFPIGRLGVFILLGLILFTEAPSLLAWAESEMDELVLNEERISARPSLLQDLIDAANEGDVIVPPPGVYSGPVVINKGVTLDGKGLVTITGDGARHALVIYGSDSVITGLHLTNTGQSTETEEACILIAQGNRNRIEGNRMDECFMGVDLKKANENVIRKNSVRGKTIDLGLRGDGLRLWYSMDNKFDDNEVSRFKDLVVWYSHGNELTKNQVTDCRYSIHFMFSGENLVQGNRFVGNSVGVYVMYTGKVRILDNYIANSYGPTGMAVGFKEASDVFVERNDILYCAVGVGVDLSPFEPDSKVVLKNNRFAYNSVAVQFNSRMSGTEVQGNLFEGNIDQISVAMNETASLNVFQGNYWDTFEGFDRDHDGIADNPYEMYSFVDKIWMETPVARFFKNSPMMEFIDFLEQLAPITAPTLILKDERPVMEKEILLREKETATSVEKGD